MCVAPPQEECCHTILGHCRETWRVCLHVNKSDSKANPRFQLSDCGKKDYLSRHCSCRVYLQLVASQRKVVLKDDPPAKP